MKATRGQGKLAADAVLEDVHIYPTPTISVGLLKMAIAAVAKMEQLSSKYTAIVIPCGSAPIMGIVFTVFTFLSKIWMRMWAAIFNSTVGCKVWKWYLHPALPTIKVLF